VSLLDPLRAAPAQFISTLRDHEITMLRMPASLLRRIVRVTREPDALPTLRSVSVFGEALLWSDVAAVREHLSSRANVVTSYGTTEAGRVTVRSVGPEEPIGSGAVGVGSPIEDRRVWIDDGSGRSAAVGVDGEIVIEGPLRRTGAGIEPLSDGEARVRPGDVGRLEADGSLTLVGRSDRMLKIAALRVEPDRVEDALLELPGVIEAAVVPLELAPGEFRLVAHVVVAPADSISKEQIAATLREALPSVAVPARITIHADALPVLASGKIDRRTLMSSAPGPA
jgi:acyl-coenzyme A synthetase/AMP-(fatty) acid ligase